MDYTKVDAIGANVLMRGPRPISADIIQPFKTVINLESGWFEFLHNHEFQEMGWCIEYNINYQFCPLSDFTPPDVTVLWGLVRKIRNALADGNVLVHCLHGEDRTGMVIAAYRMIVEGWSADQATKEMLSMGFHKWAYWWWIPQLGRLK